MKVIGHVICFLVFAIQANANTPQDLSSNQKKPCPEGYEPNQAGWGTCALYGIMGAVRKYMEDAYDVKMSSVNTLAELLVTHNFGCNAAEQICDSGVCTSHAIDELTRRMKNKRKANPGSSKTLQLQGDVPGYPKAALTFEIKQTVHHNTQKLGKQNMLYTVVQGSHSGWPGRNGGKHGRHAMQGLKVDGSTAWTCNSWGTSFKKVQVGNAVAYYPKLEQIIVIEIRDVMYKWPAMDKKATWQPLPIKKTFRSEL